MVAQYIFIFIKINKLKVICYKENVYFVQLSENLVLREDLCHKSCSNYCEYDCEKVEK